MHIGIDARFLQGPNTGVTNYLFNLLKGLSRLDRDNIYSIFISDPNYNGRIPKVNNFHTRIKTLNALLWKNLWLPREVRKLKIDVMHFPAYTVSFIGIGRNIVTIPDVIHKVNPDWFSAKELFLLDLPIRLAIKKATHIIALSENTKRDIIKYYDIPEEKISVTLLAADESFRPMNDPSIREYLRDKYAINTDFILNVGVLFKRRNIPRLLESFAMLKKDKSIKHKLVIVGPGKEYFNLDAYIEKYKVNDEVIYLGYVPQEDMPLLYNAASFFVYPSLYEGFGLPVLEAMSCGKAVITSNVSAMPEVIGNAGLMIDPYNTEELYDAVYRLIKDSILRENLVRMALERIKLFSWDKLTEQTIEIYGRVMYRNRKFIFISCKESSPKSCLSSLLGTLLISHGLKVKRRHTPRKLWNAFWVRLQFFLRTAKVRGYPTFLVVEATNICNLKCPLCPTGQGLKGRPKGKLTFANFKKIMDEIGSYIYTLRLENWGEPLLNEEISEMVSYAKLKKIVTSFNTNLNFLNERMAEKLILSGLDHIKISLDGASAESYIKYRVGGDFNNVVDNIKLLVKKRADLKKLNPFIEIQFIVMKHNEAEIEQMKQLCTKLGIDGLLIERLRPDMREELFNPDIISIEKFKEWLPRNNEYSLFDYQTKTRKYKPKVCSYLWTTVVINWDGSVVPCCSIYDEKYDFGNIFKTNFCKIWNGSKYIAARRLIGLKKKTYVDVVCEFCYRNGIIS